MRKWVAAVIAAGVVTSASAFARAAPPFLHAEGTRIVTESGTPVVLGGVNLGGWLVEEMWMQPFVTMPPAGTAFKEVKDPKSLWGTIETRLGQAEMRRVKTAWRSNWITEADFDRIKAAHLNVVRVPFLYDLLDEPDGWRWLDKACDWAKARNLYVILDMHGVPGRQSGEGHTGEAGVNKFWSDPKYADQTAALWTKIAMRYKNRPEVAGYDIINEPMGGKDAATLHVLQDRVVRAIRAVDQRHIVIVEDGYKGRDAMPWAESVGWKNVVYSTHLYQFNSKSEAEQDAGAQDYLHNIESFTAYRKVPHFIGEVQFEPHGTAKVTANFINRADTHDTSWATWTFKTAFQAGNTSLWGWYHAPKPVDALNPFTDSADTLVKKCAAFRTENLEENAVLTAAFRARPSVTQ